MNNPMLQPSFRKKALIAVFLLGVFFCAIGELRAGALFLVASSSLYFMKTAGIPILRTDNLASEAARAEALHTRPRPGYGLLYVCRINSSVKLANVEVEIDGVGRGSLQSPRFLRLVLPAGTHVVNVGVPGSRILSNAQPMTIEVIAGETAGLEIGVTGIPTVKGTLTINPTADVTQLRQKLNSVPMVRESVAG